MTTRMKKTKGDFSKAIVVIVVLLNIIFATAVLYVFRQVGSEPTSLVIAWFSFTTVELWTLAGIRKAKLDHHENIN